MITSPSIQRTESFAYLFLNGCAYRKITIRGAYEWNSIAIHTTRNNENLHLFTLVISIIINGRHAIQTTNNTLNFLSSVLFINGFLNDACILVTDQGDHVYCYSKKIIYSFVMNILQDFNFNSIWQPLTYS